MLYVVGLITGAPDKNGNTQIRKYKLIDTLSESQMNLTPTMLEHVILHCKMPVANAKIHKNKIKLPSWVNQLASRKLGGGDRDFILLAKDGESYKVATRYGIVTRISLQELKELLKEKEMANYKLIDGQINWIDTYEIVIDRQFEKEIAEKYRIFIAKALILGYGDVSFEYAIENHQVKLQRYTGSSRNVIIPSFVTAIRMNAFREVTLETLSLNEGLQVIGTRAFAPVNRVDGLETVEIPSTVGLIGNEAFANNKGLYYSDKSLNMTKLKLRNTTTLVLDESN